MPNRYIREDAIESEPVNDLTWQGEVFWRRLLNRVDDFGRFSAHPELLRASLFPLQLVKVSAQDIDRLLVECEEKGLLYTYTVGAKRLLVMNKWEQGRAKESKYPEPPEYICQRMQTYVYKRGHMSPTPTPTPIPTHTPIPAPPPTPREGACARPVNIEEVVGVGAVCGISEQDCRNWHTDMEACGWAKVDGTPFGNWKRELTIHRDRVRERQARQNGTSKPPTGERKEIQEKIQIRKAVFDGNGG